MAIIKVPTTVDQLLATATQSAANITKHRDAMAQVAAQAAMSVQAQAPGGGETK